MWNYNLLYFISKQNDLMEKIYFKCYELFHKIGKDLPVELKAKYYEALMEYGLYGVEPDDPVIKSLLQWPMYSIQKTNDGLVKKSNGWKKHTWNQYTKGDTKWKAQKNTVEDNGTPMEDNGTEWNKEEHRRNIEEYRSNNKENLIKENPVSVSNLVKVFEWDNELMSLFIEIQPVREWIEYKQAKKERAYKTSKWFIQQMKVIYNDIKYWQPRGDIPKRMEFAVNQAMENNWKGIFRDEKIEAKYQSFKSLNRKHE